MIGTMHRNFGFFGGMGLRSAGIIGGSKFDSGESGLNSRNSGLNSGSRRVRRLAYLGLGAVLGLGALGAEGLAQSAYRPGDTVISVGGGFLGGGRALLHMPRRRPSAAVILLPGGSGYVGIGENGSIARRGNWLVRTRRAYARSGIASLLLDQGAHPGQAIRIMRKITPKVVLVAMSRGSTRLSPALSYRPNGVVFASAMLNYVRRSLGSPGSLPSILVIHHRRDFCRVTHVDMVPPFMRWAGRKARVLWINGGTSRGRICGGRAYHGFVGREGRVVSAIVRFVRSVR